MARSLRDLVEFLLEEISLCGAQGESICVVLLLYLLQGTTKQF